MSRHRKSLVCLFALCGSLSRAGQVLEDNFERPTLAGGPVAWEVKGTWEIEKGQLVNRTKGRERWPNEMVSFRAPKPMPVGGIVRVDGLHNALHRSPGYLALTARDSDSKAYVEWVSNRNSTGVAYRTSATDPEIKPPPNPCTWAAGQPATYAIRWKGHDEKTDKGSVELLFAPKAGADAELSVALAIEVAALRKLDRIELVLNAEDQAAAAQTAAFDNFHVELCEGPDPPSDFAAQPGAEGFIRIAWKDVADEEAYILQRAAGPDGDWQELARLPANAVAHEDRQARPSVLYRYRLRAENKKGTSGWTAPADVILPGPPLAPSGLTARVSPAGLACLEWQDNAVNEEQFVVERGEGEEGPWQTLEAANADAVSATDWVPLKGTVRYRVRAVNGLGASPWSNVAVAKRPAPPPTILAPTGRLLYTRQAELPAASVELAFDQPVKGADGPPSAADFTISALKHPWHPGPLPTPTIASVTLDQGQRKAKLAFAPPIPDGVEYRIAAKPTLTGLDGAPVAAPPIRIAVLLGDDDRDGFVAPAPGERLGKRLPMPPMPVGIMAEDIEWHTENGAHNVEHIIELMDAYKGIDFFRVNLWWDVLEPEQGTFDPRYVGFLRRVLAAAEKHQLPLEIGIRQVRWPLWACNHKGFHNALYEPKVAAKFADTWQRLAALCHECPVVFAYWLISEEYPGSQDLKKYLAYVETVSKAIRAAHPGCVIKVRPAAEPFRGGLDVTPAVSQRGAQDICMAAGVYPTGWQWDINNPTPLSTASFNNMEAFRYYASEVQGGPNGIGEIGFRVPPGSKFGDAERLVAFQRCMSLAHDLGLLEFVIWGESWTFSDPASFLPKLLEFRDLLARRPHGADFDLRLVNDTNADFAHPPYTKEAKPDLSSLFRWLDERGYRYFLTTPAAMATQKGQHKVSVALSELAKVGPPQQLARLAKALAGTAPKGIVLPWLDRRGYQQSLTGLPCDVEIQFPGAAATCDAVSLSPTRLQVYAPPGTLVRWRRPTQGGDWNDFATPRDSFLTIIDLGKP